jgi:hypothetical protein
VVTVPAVLSFSINVLPFLILLWVSANNLHQREDADVVLAPRSSSPSLMVPVPPPFFVLVLLSMLKLLCVSLLFSIPAVFVFWFVSGRRNHSRVRQKACAGTLTHLRHYLPGLPREFERSGLHRFNVFAASDNGPFISMVSLIPNKRCDPLSFLYDSFFNRQTDHDFDSPKSVLALEFVFKPNSRRTFGLHVQSRAPQFAGELGLEPYPVDGLSLVCFTDLGVRHRNCFLGPLNSFIASHPGVLRLAAFTDTSQFELRQDSRHAVRLEFLFDEKSEDFVFGMEIVGIAVFLVDLFERFQLPKKVCKQTQDRRTRILRSSEK